MAEGRGPELDALLAQGRAEIQAKSYEAAAATLTRGLEARPGDVDFLFYRGLALLRKGDLAAAEQDYGRLVERSPEHGDGRYNRAWCLRQLGKAAEAEAEYGRYLQARPDDPEALLERALIRLAAKRDVEAQADLERALKFKPESADLRFHRGRALMGQGLWEKAIADFDEALRLNAETTNAYYNRAWCRGKLGDHAGGVQDYTRYLEFYPKNVDGFLQRGNRRLDLCDLRGTLADYEKSLELDPSLEKDLRTWIDLVRKMEKLERDGPNDQFVAACVERGAAKRDGAEHATALLWFGRALEVDADAAAAFDGRALTHMFLGKHEEALKDAARAVELAPAVADYWSDRGRVRRAAGDKAGSLADFARALELKPDHAGALVGRAYTHIQLEDFAAAVKDYERYLAVEPKPASDILYNLGWARRKLGRSAEALEPLTRAIELNPVDADAWCQRGYAKRETGDKAGARSDLRRAVELKPDLKDALEKYLADMDAAPSAAKPTSPAPAAALPVVKPTSPAAAPPASVAKGAVVGYVIALAVVVLLGISGIPILGDIPARVVDMPYKVAWMASHWTDAGAFPAKSNLCMEPRCTRTDTHEKQVGGRSGYTSQVDYYYCEAHIPTFFSMGSRHDGFLYFLYWGAVLALSLILVPALAMAILLPCWLVLIPMVLARKLPASRLFPLLASPEEPGAGLDGLVVLGSALVLLAGWILYAWF